MINEDTLTIQTLSEHSNSHQASDYYDEIKDLCWISFWVNLGIALFKLLVGALTKTVGAMGYSQLLIIDGLNSAGNAIIISVILFGITMSHSLTINEKYPFGMGKAQYIGTLLVGILLSISAAIILALALQTFLIPIHLESVGLGLATGLISIAGNLMLVRYIKLSGFENNEEFKTIIRLQRINIISSVILCNSLILTGLLGWFFMERLGSLSISLIVVGLSIKIIKKSLDGIMDRSCGQDTETTISDIIKGVNGVHDVQCVRTRHVGQNICIDIRFSVNGDYSIRQTDQIDQTIRKRLSQEFSRVNHVITLDCFPA
nr:magnetosome protein MamMB-like [Desulfobacteraceae bacterium]